MIHVCSCFIALPFYTGFEGDDISDFLTVHLSMKYIENIGKKRPFTHTIFKVLILKLKTMTLASSLDKV